MSSPNHLTSGIEDAFSSNFPDFILASPDYVPASPGKTYSSSSNSFGVVPIASPTLSLFHDDPYIKVMQAFYYEKSPIPPPTIIPQSPMLNPQEFFILEGLLPPKKRGCSSSSTSALPQDFERGESSRKTSLERHEEQIEEILNHLDELSPDHIEYIERTWKRSGTEGAVGLICWFEQTESVFSRSNCTEDCKVKFATGGPSTQTAEQRASHGSSSSTSDSYLSACGEERAYANLCLIPNTMAARIICDGEVVHIPINGETLIIRGKSQSKTRLKSHILYKNQKIIYLEVVKFRNPSNGKEVKREKTRRYPSSQMKFPEVFPEDLPGLPPVRQVEFQINLIPRATPVAPAHYRLAPSDAGTI
ncbi:hypothetical protein Tco_1312200 [Tanacetum coccineum]